MAAMLPFWKFSYNGPNKPELAGICNTTYIYSYTIKFALIN